MRRFLPPTPGSLGFDVVPSDDQLVVVASGDRRTGRTGRRQGRLDADARRPTRRRRAAGGRSRRRVRSRGVSVSGRSARVSSAAASAIAEEIEFRDGSNAAAVRTIVRQPERGEVVKFGHLPPLFARLETRAIERDGPDDRRHRVQRLDDADRSRARRARSIASAARRASSSTCAAIPAAC